MDADDDQGDNAGVLASVARSRRTPAEADDLRARMIREGYPLAGISTKENNRLWVTLTQERRWGHLQRLTGMTAAALRVRIKQINAQHLARTGRK